MPRTFIVPDEDSQVADMLARLGAQEVQTLPPGPDAVALAMIGGMLASGRYGDSVDAVIGQAWAAVGAFYVERQNYAEKYSKLYFPDDEPAFITADDLPDAEDEADALNAEAQNQ